MIIHMLNLPSHEDIREGQGKVVKKIYLPSTIFDGTIARGTILSLSLILQKIANKIQNFGIPTSSLYGVPKRMS